MKYSENSLEICFQVATQQMSGNDCMKEVFLRKFAGSNKRGNTTLYSSFGKNWA